MTTAVNAIDTLYKEYGSELESYGITDTPDQRANILRQLQACPALASVETSALKEIILRLVSTQGDFVTITTENFGLTYKIRKNIKFPIFNWHLGVSTVGQGIIPDRRIRELLNMR